MFRSVNKYLNTALMAASVLCVGADCCVPISDSHNLRSALLWANQMRRPSPRRNREYASDDNGVFDDASFFSIRPAMLGTALDPCVIPNSLKVGLRYSGIYCYKDRLLLGPSIKMSPNE